MIWYEAEVKQLEKEKDRLAYEPKMIFYGSSSIRLWNTLYQDFSMFHPINLGFGGSTIEACVWFFDRIMKAYKPDHIVVYAGDNDLGDGKKPEQVFALYQQLSGRIRNSFNGIPFTYISVKPSLARWKINHSIEQTNQLIKQAIESGDSKSYFVNVYEKMVDVKGYPLNNLYEEDGLHLNEEGYLLWKDILLRHLLSIHEPVNSSQD